ncbi:MAG: SIMPL domain-containing protein [Nitrosarchaeum sp.]
MKHSKQIFAAVIAVLVVSVTMSAISVAPNADAQVVTSTQSNDKVISVSGTATSSIKPDLANISFGVEIQEKTAKDALASNSELMSKVIAAIKQVGITDSEISTSQFNIYPVYDNYQDKETGRYTQELVGYRVSNIVNVKTVKLDKVAAIIDSAVSAGVNRVDSVFFSLSPEVNSKLKDSLLEKAILNAKSKAEMALSPLKYKIIGVKEVSLSEFSMPHPMPMYDMAFAESATKSFMATPIFSSDQDVNTSVNVVFLIGSN